jgi:hypothetical protein
MPTKMTPEQLEQLRAKAEANQLSRSALTSATLIAALNAWSQIDLAQIFSSWWRLGIGSRIFVLLSAAQESAALDAIDFIDESFDLLDRPIARPALIPQTFAGIASDGRDLEGLLTSAPVITYQRVKRGDPPAVAARAGEDFLRRAITTQVADAGRAADQVAIATAVPEKPEKRRAQYGYVRMLNPPSCSRCILLAGKFYRWNQGFQRHEMCDCAHIPAIEDVADDITTNPYEYFKSLTEEQQNEAFGKANAQAIRDGADISQVVNATTRGGVRTADDGMRYTLEGTTRRGFYGRRNKGVLRPTPWQIYRDSRGDPDEARRLLRQYRYILR